MGRGGDSEVGEEREGGGTRRDILMYNASDKNGTVGQR